MPAFSLGLLLFITGSVCLSLSLAQGSYSAGLYADVQRVNRSESLVKVRALPIVHFRFLLDSVPDRVQLGVLGAEAQRLFPESIDVLPSAPFAPPRHTHTHAHNNNNGNNKARSTISISSSSSSSTHRNTNANNDNNNSSGANTNSQKTFTKTSANNNSNAPVRPSAPVVVTNFPVVDKSVLFMHGLVALQELLYMYEALLGEVALLGDKDAQLRRESEHLLRRLQQEAHTQTRERLALAEQAHTHAQRERAAEEERAQRERERVTLSLQEEKALLQYEESLARARLTQQEKASQSTLTHQWEREQALAEKRESTQRAHTLSLQSARQTQSAALEAQRLSFEKEKIRAEIEARAQQDKLNEERAMRKLQAQSQLDTQRMVQGIQSISLQLSALLKDVLSRPRQLLVLAGIAVALIASFFLVRELSSLVRQWVQARIGKPSLVRETSFHWSLLPTEDLWETLSSLWRTSSSTNEEDARLSSHWQRLEDEFRDVILGREDKQRVLQLALATRNTRRSGAPYRHVLLHGPPGTGKTLIARRLAQSSGMDYAVLSGGDVAPLGEDAVSQLHALFRWANRSRRGLLVFIDEAEAFLASRSQTSSSSGEGGGGVGSSGNNETHLRNSLNALLYQTGTPSRKFMMILATNRPEDLDSAVLDRIDVSIQVSLPQEEQRQQLVKLYMHLHLVLPAKKSETRTGVAAWLLPKPRDVKRVDEECLQEKHVVTMAKMTEGFSGREISKLFISAQYAMFLAEKQTLTWPILKRTVDVKIGEHRIKSSGFQTVVTIAGDDDSREEDQEVRWKKTDKTTGNVHKK